MKPLALLLPSLLLSTSALAGVPGWTMSEASGQVTVASSGFVRAASRGATLSAGDVISTGAKGRAVIVRGQEYLVVAPNSRIRVADPAKSGGMTQIIEQIGNVVFKIKKMATPHFAVETPFLAAVVKGTTFSVTVTESGASVQVVEGRVEVETRDGGARYLVLPGDIGSVSGKALGRLNVQGRETKTLVSPSEGRSVAAPTAELLQPDPVATPEQASPTVIALAVTEPPVRMGPATDGMVSGALIAAAATTPERNAALAEARQSVPESYAGDAKASGGAPSPDDQGTSSPVGSPASSAESGAASAGDAGDSNAATQGNGNGHANAAGAANDDNGVTAGSSGDNAAAGSNDAANGNTGNGNGNGNANGGGDGAGNNGNGNGNGGGNGAGNNGNGNGGGDGAGNNGNGNGNANGGGNGNANGGGNGAGNNGNGNGNGGGNGAGNNGNGNGARNK